MPNQTLGDAARALAAGRASAASLVEAALSRIAEPGGEGARAFVAVQAEAARAAAGAMDALRRAGRAPSPWAGVPVAVKDLLDQAGVPTRAGSPALDDAPPAARTAPAIARLERAGFVVVGRTNMVAFAFSGTGINPDRGTPLSPWDRATGRLPGGSSSGAGVAVADRMALGAIGSDTGGSCRIPAALCGVVGWKPTARRVPLAGAYPLSPSLDSLGPLANSAACCAVLDAVMAGEAEEEAPPAAALDGLRLGLPSGSYLFDGVEPGVTAAFSVALRRLERAGARLVEAELPELADIPRANAAGGFAAVEAWEAQRDLIARARGRYDPLILSRIERGAGMTAAALIALTRERARISAALAARTAGLDAILAPTCPLPPPPLSALSDPAEFSRVNLLLLRNPAVANFLDRCSISLPCHEAGEAPVGLMLIGEHGGDRRLLSIARGVEAALVG